MGESAAHRWVSSRLDEIGVSIGTEAPKLNARFADDRISQAQVSQAYSLWVISRCCYVALKMLWYFYIKGDL